MLSDKAKRILALSRRGLDHEEISEVIGETPASVRKSLEKAYKDTLDEGRVTQVFNNELGKLQELTTAYFDLAAGTARMKDDEGNDVDIPADPEAAKLVLQIHDRIAKMTGINAPEKLKVTHSHEDALAELE